MGWGGWTHGVDDGWNDAGDDNVHNAHGRLGRPLFV